MTPPTELEELQWEHSSSDPHRHRFLLHAPADLWVFVHHFPASPLLPAFCQLGEVLTRVRRAWPELGPLLGAPAIKFKAPIRPDTRLELNLVRVDGGQRIKFTIAAAAEVYASGTLMFGLRPSRGPA